MSAEPLQPTQHERRLRQRRKDRNLTEARLENSQRIARIGDWDHDLVQNRLIWSEEIYRILGLKRADGPPEAAAFYRLVHPDDLAFVHWEKKIAAAGSRPVNFEHRIIRPDGKVRYIHQIVEMTHDEQGRPVRESGILQDITARKLADESLRESEARFAGAFAHAPSGVALIAPNGRWLKVNRALCALVGYTEAEMLSRTFQDITHPEDLAVDLEAARQLLAGEIRSCQMEKRYLKATGQVVTVLLDVSLVRDSAGRPGFFIAHIQDITARKLAEVTLRQEQALLSSLISTIPDHIYIKDRQSRFLRVNASMSQRIGLRHPGEAIGKSDLDFFTPEHAQTAYQQEQRIMATGEPLISFEEKETWADGSVAWASTTKVPWRNPAGEIVGLIGVKRDITERKQLHEHLLQAQKMEALGRFSGGVAHDFNNILGAIGGYAELARLQLQGNPAVGEHLDAVIKASNRAADLVRQILMFSRQQPQTRELLLLQPIVIESMKLMRATIPSTIEIDALIAADAPPVLANANQIHQLLMNLEINGWHALKNQPGRLQVQLEKVTVDAALAVTKPGLRPGTYARLTVSDTGCGMDPATLRRIFEPFFTTKPPGEGTGLGLAVVHGIMESHDGAVTVHSQPGEGTSFRLYFPEHVGAAAPGGIEAEPTPRGQGECVLVVDDEVMLTELSADFLTRLGYTTVSTTASAQALAMVRADPSRYALVLTDQTMPGMSGLQLAGELRDIRPDLPIMLMTGYNLSLTTDRIGASGIRNILHKPFTMHTLGIVVHATLTGTTIPGHGSNSSY